MGITLLYVDLQYEELKMTKCLSIGLASVLIPLSSFGLTLEQAV